MATSARPDAAETRLTDAGRAGGGRSPCLLCGAVTASRLFSKGEWDFVRCGGCGLVSLSPLPTPEQLQRHHDASYAAGAYAVYAAAEPIRIAVARHRLPAVRALAPEGPWLDVGCSTGSFMVEARRAGIAIEGLEMSAAAVERARSQGLDAHHGTVETFVPGRRYAAITAFDVVEHLRDPVAFVRTAASWLAPRGVLALTVPNIASLAARVMRRHWYYYAAPDHLHYFTPATLRRLLALANLDDIALRPASKPLTLDYAALALAQFNPRLGRFMQRIVGRCPRALRSRPWPLRIGEMAVTARFGGSERSGSG
jgi:2-polyprenyl-3-methyl-5-hydroxy-6-metoxy-1,4-benzoquinol methylase